VVGTEPLPSAIFVCGGGPPPADSPIVPTITPFQMLGQPATPEPPRQQVGGEGGEENVSEIGGVLLPIMSTQGEEESSIDLHS